jgi:acetylornithine aminotransferase
MTQEIIKKADQVIAKTYKRFPIVIAKGKGCTLWDTQGKKYTDFVAGIAVCNLGHAHPGVSKALSKQADTLFHVSNLYYTIPQVELASRLTENSFADRVFFCNSGAEANEAAIKLTRKYFKEKGESGKYRIISMEHSFHGRTMATLSATGQDKIKQGFEPVLEGFDYVPFNDISALRSKIGPSTCAVLIEPIQGEGGVRCPDPEYLKAVRQALANGLPIGAMLAREEVADAFGPGSHASTFGGTPVVTAASLEVVRVLSEENIIDHCKNIGVYFKERLSWLKDRHELIEDVRGMGLLLGMKLSMEGDQIVASCMEKGFLINCIQGNILRFIPPLIIEKQEIDALVACLDEVFNQMVR